MTPRDPAARLPEAVFDLVVIGGGVVGAATALAAARGDSDHGRKKLRVLLLEQYALGHERGSSHGDGRIVRFTYPEPEYLAMARAAFPAWRALEQQVGQPLLLTTGSWECGPAGSPRLEELELSLRQARLPFSKWSVAESRRHFPHFELPLGSRVLYQPDGAVVRASAAVSSLWQMAEAHGALAFDHCRVAKIDLGTSPILLETSRGPCRAERLALCAGGWMGPLMADLDLKLPLTVTREVVAYFPVSSRAFASMADHRVGAMPAFIDYHGDPPFYGLPQIDVGGVKVGWHGMGSEALAATEGEPEPQLVRRLQSYVGDRLPYLDLHPVAVKTCLYTNTPDRHFLLDHLPGNQGRVVMGGGFSGHGFKFGPILGEILADLVSGQAPPFDLSLFALERWNRPGPPARRQSA